MNTVKQRGPVVGSGLILGWVLLGSWAMVPAATGTSTWKRLPNTTGYVVMLRHATAPGVGDPPNFKLGDCSTQRNLSPQGRAQAKRIGQAFRQRQIQIAQVLSSQWCRCLETARLLELGPVKPFSALNSFFRDRQTEPRQTAAIRQLIINHRPRSGVLVLVTHQVNITALSGLVPSSGGAVVLRATAQEQIEVIGELPPE